MKKTIASALLFVLAAACALAENGRLRMKSDTDWENGRLVLSLFVPLDLDRLLFPQARRAAELEAESERGDLFLEGFAALTLRSSQTVGEFLADPNPTHLVRRVTAALPALSRRGVKTVSSVSKDFKSITVVYEYPFSGTDGLLSPFVAQDRPVPLPDAPGYHATRPFTGLVIDARGKILSFGKNAAVPCRPALFPRIFFLTARRTIEPVLDMTMVEPAALEKWGMVGYVRSPEKSAYAPRAGVDPLTVTAFAVYGIYDTDLVISEESALMLLANEQNRELLRRGKIVVIID